MLEFFLALFGSIFYGTKYAGYRASQKEIAARNEISESYRGKLQDYGKKRMLHSQFLRDRWIAANEVSDNLTAVFGQDWEQVLRNTPFVESILGRYDRKELGFIDVWNVVYDIYLAKYGVCMSQRFNPNIRIRGVDELSESVEASKKTGIAVCREIERNIQANYGEYGFRLYQDICNPHLLVWEYVVDSYAGEKGKRYW